jgi:hypothetical protein
MGPPGKGASCFFDILNDPGKFHPGVESEEFLDCGKPSNATSNRSVKQKV